MRTRLQLLHIFRILPLLFVATTLFADAAFAQATRINVGGESYTDSLGRVWVADQFFSGGDVYQDAVPISGTSEDTLYQSERYGDPFSY
ncbi:MAG: hypothetical protein KDD44_13120, partial [Bdellovibrionales bacterium]|nr:hypothetical protein [Bdellovibrionales bacterium]